MIPDRLVTGSRDQDPWGKIDAQEMGRRWFPKCPMKGADRQACTIRERTRRPHCTTILTGWQLYHWCWVSIDCNLKFDQQVNVNWVCVKVFWCPAIKFGGLGTTPGTNISIARRPNALCPHSVPNAVLIGRRRTSGRREVWDRRGCDNMILSKNHPALDPQDWMHKPQ